MSPIMRHLDLVLLVIGIAAVTTSTAMLAGGAWALGLAGIAAIITSIVLPPWD